MRLPSPPASLETRFALSGRSPTLTPTPMRSHGGEELFRSPTPAYESVSDGSVFWEYKELLGAAKTLVTFEWDAESLKGTLVPIP